MAGGRTTTARPARRRVESCGSRSFHMRLPQAWVTDKRRCSPTSPGSSAASPPSSCTIARRDCPARLRNVTTRDRVTSGSIGITLRGGLMFRGQPRRGGVLSGARHENEFAALRTRLAEAEETLRAIRSGEVDALVVQTAGDQIFTLSGADHPYRVMVETMQEGAATVSDGGLVLYANRRLGELLGTPLHRLIGTSASSFVATDDRAAFEHLLRSVAGGGVHTDLKLQRAERDPFTVRIAASPLNLDDTHAVCLVITDLRFHHVFDDAPIGVVTVSVAAGSAGQFLQVNHAMCQLTGYSTDELLSLTVADITHPDDVADTHDIFRGAATGALSQFREEQRYLRADGGVVWASTNGTVVRSRDGNPAYVIAHVEDITARKQADHALADSEKRFRSVFFDAPIGVALVSLAADPGRYLQVNQAFCNIVGYRADELVTRRFTDITHPDDGAGTATFLAQLLDNSLDGVDREKRYFRPDGTVVWASIRASTIRGEHGRPLYALVHIEDITERRQAQEQLTYQALHDPLTGLGNRHLLMARLQHALDALDRAAGAVAVLYLDLDGFKAVNDRVGHDIGDRFLIEIGRHIQDAVRRPDTAVRLGGDEFVVVAVDISDDSLLPIVERVKAAVTQSITIDADTFTVSASVGVVVTHNSHDDPTDLLRAADLAMYHAKKDGRGRHQIFTDALRVQAMEHLDIQPELRRAIGHDLLRLYYQPVVDVRTGHAVGVEALLRLQHPTRGLLTPGAFLDVAEIALRFGRTNRLASLPLSRDRWRHGVQMHGSACPVRETWA